MSFNREAGWTGNHGATAYAGTHVSLRRTARRACHDTRPNRTGNYRRSLRGRREGRIGKRWRDEKCCSRRAAIWGLKDPDAHQLLMLNSESDHCLSVGLEHSHLALLPTIFNRQPCSAPALASFLAERKSTLMDIILPHSVILPPFGFLSLSLHAVSFLSIFYLSPHFRAHTVQQHLPLRLFNLRSLFDIWAEQNTLARLTCHQHNVFSPFNRRASSVAFRAIPFNPFHLYDINHWWCQSFYKHTLNSFFLNT